jgi:Asp-tRNA(Asn)/Glu-tRNA(Gln) amidotransferase A subunit family amidase
MPCITLPFGTGPTGLPVGVQFVGRQHEDPTLLDIAAWARGALS